MDPFYVSLISLLGAACPVSMYLLLEMEKVDSKSLMYFVVNGIGSVILILTSGVHLTWGDLGGIAMETAWLIISLMGIGKVLYHRRVVKLVKEGGENV